MEESKEELKTDAIKCVIELSKDGALSVSCPMIGDTFFMCGMLEMSKAVVFQYKANQAKIVKPQGNIMDFVRRNRLK